MRLRQKPFGDGLRTYTRVMPRETYSARLDGGDAERVEQYRKDQQIESTSEAVRRLIRAGLTVEGYGRGTVMTDGGETTRPVLEHAASTAAVAAVLALVAAGMGIVPFVVGARWTVGAVVAALILVTVARSGWCKQLDRRLEEAPGQLLRAVRINRESL